MTHIVLVGLMATGKSSVGRRVASRLERPLFDSDSQVEARTGRSVRDIWQSDGEAAFRQLETDALRDACDRTEPSVIAGAGGVVLAEANRIRLRADDVRVVWLRARADTLVDRVQRSKSTHRPLLDGDPTGTLERMTAERTPLYTEVADHIVDVDDLSLDQVATLVVDQVLRAEASS